MAIHRMPLIQYLDACLSSVLGGVEIADGARTVHPNSFRFRTRSLDRSDAHPLARDSRTSHVLAKHIAALLVLTVPEAGPGRPIDQCRWSAALRDEASDSGSWCGVYSNTEDYVFAYPLPTQPRAENPTLATYAAQFLAIVLDIVEFDEDGEAVRPSHVVHGVERVPITLTCPTQAFPLGSREELRGAGSTRQPLHSIASTEPALVMLARHWALVASLTSLALEGGETAIASSVIDGFQLRRTADWLIPANGHPSEVYEYLARVCNVKCKFCYLYGNPSALAVAKGAAVISRDELATRLKYFDPETKTSLFRAQWELNEFLVDPKLPWVLRDLRERVHEPFYFITNGSPLTEKMVKLLAEHAPVHLIVSINTLDADLRNDTMGERTRQTDTALQALSRLKEAKIPFGLSLAAFPDYPLDDLVHTIRNTAEYGPAFVRVNLPGFTRDLPYEGHIDTEAYWSEVVKCVQATRELVDVPLITIPSAFEQNHFYENPLEARIIGTVAGSPAAETGLRPNDVIRSVGAMPIRSRGELLSILMLVRAPTRLVVERRDARIDLELVPREPEFPYPGHVMGKYLMPHGVVVAPSLTARNAADIEAAMEAAGAQTSWLLTSEMMLPAAQALLRSHLSDRASRIDFLLATNEFLGGNIRITDMCTIGDIYQAARKKLQSSPKPDVIIMSDSGFTDQGRDLQGRHWRDLEHALGIPVRLISVTRFPY